MCSSSGRRQTPQAQKINPSGMCFEQDWHWTVLDICPNSYNSMLPISWIMRRDSSLNVIEFSGFSQTFKHRFRAWAISEFPHYFLDLTQPFSIFQDYILCNSFNSEVNFKFRLFFLNRWLSTPHPFPDARWFWVVCWSTLFLSLHQFLGAWRRTLRCVFQLLLLLLRLPGTHEYYLWCGTRRRESFK